MAGRTGQSEKDRNEQLRSLAAVDEVLREEGVRPLLDAYGRDLVVDAVRTVIGRLRAEILAGVGRSVPPASLRPTSCLGWRAFSRPRPRPRCSA